MFGGWPLTFLVLWANLVEFKGTTSNMTRSKKSTRGSLLAKGGIRRQPAKFKRAGPASPAAQAPADLDECLQRLRSLRVEDMADEAAQFIEKIGSLMYKILAAEARGVVDSAFVSRAVDAQGNVLNEGMKVLPLPCPTPTHTSALSASACLCISRQSWKRLRARQRHLTVLPTPSSP